MNLATELAPVAQAAAYIPFLNLQYIYCTIVTLFGKACAVDGVTVPSVDVPSVDGVVSAATTTAQGVADAGGGFWSWLWPFGGGSEVDVIAATTTAVQEVGFWASLVSSVPGPIHAVFVGIGLVFAFLWTAFSWISFSLSGLTLLAIILALSGLVLIRVKEWSDFGTLPVRIATKSHGWSRWQDILNEGMSGEPKRWRTGIIAADDMLGELLARLGYHGEVTSEQMRSVPEGAFITLPQAWEAHRIKNFVSARNSNFILTQREAFRVMKLYEQVFEEFDFI